MKENITLTICGDICPTDDTIKYFENSDIDTFLGETKSLFLDTDLLIGNMEFPLCDKCNKAIKTGPILYGKTSFVNFFKSLNFTALGMGNNHIKDCGPNGVLSSLSTVRNSGIKTVGAGKNEIEAKKPLILEKNGIKIGILSFAEHEFNVAYKDEAGANLFDVYTDYEQIETFKNEVDFLVIMYHGGIEHYAYPSPLLQKRCRKMVEKGTDYVLCQHSHIIGTEEKYLEGTILYGQGNSIYGYRENNSSWNEGLISKVTLSKRDDKIKYSISYIPIKATKKGVEKVEGEEKEVLFQKFFKRTQEIKDSNFIEESWKNFCQKNQSLYLPHIYGHGRVFNKLNRMLDNKIVKIIYSSTKHRIAHNLIRCEAHNEVVQTILKEQSK